MHLESSALQASRPQCAKALALFDTKLPVLANLDVKLDNIGSLKPKKDEERLDRSGTDATYPVILYRDL